MHESDAQYFQKLNGNLHVSTCASLYSGHTKNGYSIISLNPIDNNLIIYLRKWYKDRKEFDQETEKCEKGIIFLENFKCSNEVKNESLQISKLRQHIITYNKIEVDILNPFESINNVELDDIFVEPIITNVSNFDKENKSLTKKKYDIKDLVKLNENIIFWGGKEYGKTMLLNYINEIILKNDFEFSNKIPIFIKFSDLPKNNPNGILERLIMPSFSNIVTKEIILAYLETGKIIFIIDDYYNEEDDDRKKRNDTLLKFYNMYNKCKLIFSANENMTQTFKQKLVNVNVEFKTKNCYLAPLNTAKIREMLNKWNSNNRLEDIDKMLEQILYFFKQLRIPVTPMAVTLFIGVLFRDAGKKSIRNEAYLIENYIETILEKIRHIEDKSNFDFKDKESFLSFIAFEMYKKSKYELSKNEFDISKIEYFEHLGEKVPDIKIFEDFFIKGILIERNNNIQFKFKSWFHFFLAKKMQKERSVLFKILKSEKYLRFSKSISFKAGLDRNDIELLEFISDKTETALIDIKRKYKNTLCEDKYFDNKLAVFSNEIDKNIMDKNKNEHKDNLSDEKNLSYLPENIDEDIQVEENIIDLVTLNSDVIRNTTETSKEKKEKILSMGIDNYMALMWTLLEEFRSFINEITLQQIENTFLGYALDNKGKTAENEKLLKQKINQIIFTIVPVSIIFDMTDHLMNPKLEMIISEIYEKEENPEKKLFLCILLLRINFEEAMNKILKFISTLKSFQIGYLLFSCILIFCYENKLEDDKLNSALEALDQIRKKYGAKNEGAPVYIKDSFRSDIKKDILMLKIKEEANKNI